MQRTNTPHYPQPPADRIVPRYTTPYGYAHLPEDAFEVPTSAPSDKSIADEVRNAASTFSEAVRHARAMGLGVDVAWDNDAGKLFITIVREF